MDLSAIVSGRIRYCDTMRVARRAAGGGCLVGVVCLSDGWRRHSPTRRGNAAARITYLAPGLHIRPELGMINSPASAGLKMDILSRYTFSCRARTSPLTGERRPGARCHH